MVTTEAVRTEAETEAPVQVLVCGDVAACQSASPLHPLDLQMQVLKAHGVVTVHRTLELQREDPL